MSYTEKPLDGAGLAVVNRIIAGRYVPTTRKVNGKALSADVTLAASDVGARPSTWTPTAAQVGALTQTQGDARYLKLTGGTITGALSVKAPTADTNPATKKYVDDAIRTAVTGAMEASY